jgi:peroxiredoxin
MRKAVGAAVFFIGALNLTLFPAVRPTKAEGIPAADKVRVKLLRTLKEALPGPGWPVILVFFSASCPVCWDDLFEVKSMIEVNDFPVKLIGVSVDRPEDLEAFLRKYSFSDPVVSDRRREVHRGFQVQAAPFKLLLRDKTILYRDDILQDPKTQRERLKRCLIEMTSRSRSF